MYTTAIAEDGSVGSDKVEPAVGGELGGEATLLRLAALRRLDQLLSKDLKFDVRTYVDEGQILQHSRHGRRCRQADAPVGRLRAVGRR